MLSKLSTHLGPGSLFSGDEPLVLEFSNSTWISTNVGTYSLVDAWNEFFVTIETPFKDVSIDGNKISLIGGKDLELKTSCFSSSDLVSIKDNSRIITTLGTYSFDDCSLLTDATLKGVTYSYGGSFRDNVSLTTIILPNLQEILGDGYFFYNCGSVSNFNLPLLNSISGVSNFYNCNSMSTLNLPVCTTLGDTVLNNDNFDSITGKTIDLTVTPELLTCNGGTPDVDIQYLQSNNTVTIHIPTSITSFTPTSATFSGTTVSVVGKGFYAIDSVKIGGVEVATYSLDSFTNLSLVTGTVSDGSVSITGTYGSASKSGFEWDATVKFSYIATPLNVLPNTWTDLSSYYKDLEIKSGVSLDTLYSVLFDGSNSGYGTSSQMTVKYTNGFTIETWVNFSSLTSANYIMQFVDQDYTNTNPDLTLLTIDNDLRIQSSNSVSFSTNITANKFIKAVVTYDSSNGETKTYINGQLTNTSTLNLSTSYKKTIGKLFVGNIGSNQPMRIGMLNFVNYIQDSTTILNNYNNERNTYDEAKGSFLFNSSSSQYLSSSSPDYVIGTNSFTLEAFVKTTSQSGYDGVISMLDNNAPFNGVSINIFDGNFDFYSKGGQYTSYTASNDTWYHVAIARDNGTISYFANGRLVAQYSDSYNYTLQDLVIGRYYTDLNDHYIDGVIAQPRLTIGTALYNGTFSVTPPLTSGSNTKLLLLDAYNNQLLDSSGLTHSVISNNNVGWTSSLPSTIGSTYVQDALQFYVDASLNTSYPGSGTIWYDISGNSRDLSWGYGLTYDSANGGNIHFDGTNRALSGSNYTINFSNGITVEAVAKYHSGFYGGVFAFNGGGDYINVQFMSSGTQLRFELDAGQSLYTTGVSPDNWYHIMCVYEGASNGGSATARIYINGVQTTYTTLSASRSYGSVSGDQNSPIYLGLHDGYLNGNIGLSRFYNRALNSSEVLQNFNSSKDRFGL